MASGPIPGTQNLGAVSYRFNFGAGGGSPKAFKPWLSEPEALGKYDLKNQPSAVWGYNFCGRSQRPSRFCDSKDRP